MPATPDKEDVCLLLWAGDTADLPASANVILWNGLADRAGARCITDIVEEHGDAIRARYLSWVHELGELPVHGRPLRQCFMSDLWSQSTFVEQSPWKQPSIEPILKLMALEIVLTRERVRTLRYVGPDSNLSAVLRSLCAAHAIDYEWRRLRMSKKLTLRSLLRGLPDFLQGMLLLVQLCATRLPLPKRRLRPNQAQEPRVLISGQLFNIDAARAAKGEPASLFWTTLPALLHESGWHITWLHIFYSHDKVRTLSQAAHLVCELDRQSPRQTHLLLDAYFSVGGALRVLIRAVRSSIRSLALSRDLQKLLLQRPGLGYWPLLKADFARAFRGLGCVEELYFAECFDKALSTLPRQAQGLYLLENQGWERAMAGAWRRYGHGRLAGVAHSTIRFWDLRYHRDPRHYDSTGHEPYSGPDVVIVNGEAARAAYLSNAHNRETVVECEALRYLHLGSSAKRARRTREHGAPLKVLVVGDYLRSSTEAVLALLDNAARQTVPALVVLVKPHPNSPVDPAQFPRLNLSVETRPVATAASECDVVLAGNLTSAAVDAYASGARVLVHENGGTLNYSPLRGVPGVSFLRSPDQLAQALRALESSSDQAGSLLEYFYADPGLPRWRSYFAQTGIDEEVKYAAS